MPPIKSSFIIHHDSMAVFEKLSDTQLGKLMRAIAAFQLTGEIPKMDLVTEIAFTPFLNQFRRDEVEYQKIIERNKRNGSRGGRPQNPEKPKKPTGLSGLSEKPKKPDSDSDSDSEMTTSSVGQAPPPPPAVLPADPQFRPIEESAAAALNDSFFISEVANRLALGPASLPEFTARLPDLMEAFLAHLRSEQTHFQRVKEFRKHFKNWLPKRIRDESSGKVSTDVSTVRKKLL